MMKMVWKKKEVVYLILSQVGRDKFYLIIGYTSFFVTVYIDTIHKITALVVGDCD